MNRQKTLKMLCIFPKKIFRLLFVHRVVSPVKERMESSFAKSSNATKTKMHVVELSHVRFINSL